MPNHLNPSGIIFNRQANKINSRNVWGGKHPLNKYALLLKTVSQNQKAL